MKTSTLARGLGWALALALSSVQADHLEPSKKEEACKERFNRAIKSHTAASGDNAIGVCKPLLDQGSLWAQFYIGRMYLEGITVPKDIAKGVQMVGQAAQKGLPAAQTRVGRMYLRGEGVNLDATLAARWFYKSAQAGDGQGQLELGLRFYNGEGVPANPLEAYRWLSLAKRFNEENGADNLMMLSERKRENARSKLQPAQVEAVDKWIEEWAPPPHPE